MQCVRMCLMYCLNIVVMSSLEWQYVVYMSACRTFTRCCDLMFMLYVCCLNVMPLSSVTPRILVVEVVGMQYWSGWCVALQSVLYCNGIWELVKICHRRLLTCLKVADLSHFSTKIEVAVAVKEIIYYFCSHEARDHEGNYTALWGENLVAEGLGMPR
mgnify:CR=1 FL=1